MSLPEVELIICSCGHEFEAFHDDLGTYMCPECFDVKRYDAVPAVKPLDAFFNKMKNCTIKEKCK